MTALLTDSSGHSSSGAGRWTQSLRPCVLRSPLVVALIQESSDGGTLTPRPQAMSLMRQTALGYKNPKAKRPMTRTTVRSERKPTLRSVSTVPSCRTTVTVRDPSIKVRGALRDAAGHLDWQTVEGSGYGTTEGGGELRSGAPMTVPDWVTNGSILADQRRFPRCVMITGLVMKGSIGSKRPWVTRPARGAGSAVPAETGYR